MSEYFSFPDPEQQIDPEALAKFKRELDVALAMVGLDEELAKRALEEMGGENLVGEELDRAIKHLREQTPQDPINEAALNARREELLRLKATVEEWESPRTIDN